ncbi:unnamed protein product [Arctogadus glacialis]
MSNGEEVAGDLGPHLFRSDDLKLCSGADTPPFSEPLLCYRRSSASESKCGHPAVEEEVGTLGLDRASFTRSDSRGPLTHRLSLFGSQSTGNYSPNEDSELPTSTF